MRRILAHAALALAALMAVVLPLAQIVSADPPRTFLQIKVGGTVYSVGTINFSSGVSTPVNGVLTVTGFGSGVTADSPLTGSGTSASHLACPTCVTGGPFLPLAGGTMTGSFVAVNSASAITSGNYPLQLQTGQSGHDATAIFDENNFTRLTFTGNNRLTLNGNVATFDTSGTNNSSFQALLINNGSATNNSAHGGALITTATASNSSGMTHYGCIVDTNIVCAVCEDMVADTAGVTNQKIVVFSADGKVKDATASTNLTTVAGVAMTTAASGATARICRQGKTYVNSDAGCTVGLGAGTSGTTAGSAQCSTPPVVSSGVGKISTGVAAGVAVIDISRF